MSQEPKINIPEMGATAATTREMKPAEAGFESIALARLAEMEKTMRELVELRRVEGRSAKPSKLALFAMLLALAALLLTAGQAYFSWTARSRASDSVGDFGDFVNATEPDSPHQNDLRTQLSLAELAKRAPSIRTGTLQAWWAGEQARQVQRLEAQAKRQTLAGDREGAARSVRRADAVRSGIPSLADFEKPPAR